MQGKTVKESLTTMSYEAMPVDTNSTLLNMHGGTIAKWIDATAGVAAKRHCRRTVHNVVTVCINNLEFKNPVHIGNLINIKAYLVYTGTSSMEIEVEVEVENLRTGDTKKVSSPTVTMVGIDKKGSPLPIPRLIPKTLKEKRCFEKYKKLAEKRKLKN